MVAAHFSVSNTITIGLAAAAMPIIVGQIKNVTITSVFLMPCFRASGSCCSFEKTGNVTRPTSVAKTEEGNASSCKAREKKPSSVAENNLPMII